MSVVSSLPLSKRVLEMSESATLKMAQMARDLKAKGNDVISLSLGEPDFDTPAHIKEAAKKALDDGYTKYTPVPGLMELREAISAKFARENGLNYSASQVVVSNGAKQSIANLALALLEEGDEVIILAPYWVSYAAIAGLAGATPVYLNAGIEQDFKVSAAQIEEVITSKTKLIMFSSPCNPTGSVFTKEELEAIAKVVLKYDDLYIMSDEIYEHINFSGAHCSIGTLPGMLERTITINGFSKGFAMTGWRLGYMGAPEFIAKACTKIQGQYTSGANAFSQKAAAYALNADMSESVKMKEAFGKRRGMVIDLLSQIPGFKVNEPQGAFYIFPDISDYFGKSYNGVVINNSDEFAEFILKNAYVGIVAGSAFGLEGCFRLSYAASEEQLKEAIARIAATVQKLK